MNIQDFLSLKDGEQVRYKGDTLYGFPDTDTILTRSNSWLDDDNTVKFTFVHNNGSKDWHFFAADDIEVIKGELA